jgi:hypothetical protein
MDLQHSCTTTTPYCHMPRQLTSTPWSSNFDCAAGYSHLKRSELLLTWDVYHHRKHCTAPLTHQYSVVQLLSATYAYTAAVTRPPLTPPHHITTISSYGTPTHQQAVVQLLSQHNCIHSYSIPPPGHNARAHARTRIISQYETPTHQHTMVQLLSAALIIVKHACIQHTHPHRTATPPYTMAPRDANQHTVVQQFHRTSGYSCLHTSGYSCSELLLA